MKTKHVLPDLSRKILSDRKEGRRLRALRVAKGIQLKFVANALDISSAYLSDLESGNRHWSEERSQAFEKAIGA